MIYSTLHFVDDQQYDTGSGNAWSGLAVFGELYDLQLCDGFETTDHSVLTCVAADYLTVFGVPPAAGLQIDVWTDAGSGPGVLVASELAPVSEAQSFEDGFFGLAGLRLRAEVDIELQPNSSYYIMIQPVDLSPDGDWFYQVRQYCDPCGDSYARDGGRANGDYGTFTWMTMESLGFTRGSTSMEIAAALPACVADCNRDATVDSRDLICFLNLWAQQDLQADCDGDGIVDTRDVSCFLGLWAEGC